MRACVHVLLLVHCYSSTASMIAPLGAKSTADDVLSAFSNARSPTFRERAATGLLPPFVKRHGTAVVSGGNSGIGAEACRVLLAAGLRVVLCARDEEAGAKALAEMPGSERARVQQLDLSDLASVQTASDEIRRTEGQIDLLLLNAGVMALPQKETTRQGFEKQIGINHIGHHAFTRLLLGCMADDGRVVTVASTAHRQPWVSVDTSDLSFDKGRKYTPWGAYGQSKAANILFAKALADELAAAGSSILSVSLHPGFAAGTFASSSRRACLFWLMRRRAPLLHRCDRHPTVAARQPPSHLATPQVHPRQERGAGRVHHDLRMPRPGPPPGRLPE